MAIGNKLKQLLYERGISVKEFAEQIGVPATTLYSFIQRDSQKASIDLLWKICNGLDISLDTLFEQPQKANTPTQSDVIKLFTGSNEIFYEILAETVKKEEMEEFNRKVKERLPKDFGKPQTIAAHFDGTEFTEEELEEIRRFAEFVKSKRKN